MDKRFCVLVKEHGAHVVYGPFVSEEQAEKWAKRKYHTWSVLPFMLI